MQELYKKHDESNLLRFSGSYILIIVVSRNDKILMFSEIV